MSYRKQFFLSLFLSLTTMTSLYAQIPEKPEDISPLLIGETIPNDTLQDADGKTVLIGDVFKNKPTVLVFYRGGWCPYCNVQLSGLAKIEKEILALGYQIVAVSPDDYRNLKSTEQTDSVHYQLFSDVDGSLLQKVGIAFKSPTKLKAYVAAKKRVGETSEIMPVPTVMVVNTSGEILFEYINPNYKVRMGSELLMAVLKAL